jgi:capsule polysaccharide export protein KpsE/RkpR
MAMSETLQAILFACSAISTIGAAIVVISTFVTKAKAPNVAQNDRITVLETEMAEVKRHQDSDNKRLKSMEDGNKVTQKALLALMSHALNDNDNDKLIAAKDELERYLINR